MSGLSQRSSGTANGGDAALEGGVGLLTGLGEPEAGALSLPAGVDLIIAAFEDGRGTPRELRL